MTASFSASGLRLDRWDAFLILGAFGILIVEILLPLSWDNWVYQTMGWDLFGYGKLPYLGSWDVNFPGIVYLHAVSIALFGTSDIAFRIFDVICETLGAWFFFRLLRHRLNSSLSVLSVFVYLILYVSLTWSAAGQRDAFIPLFLFGGLLLFYQAIDGSKRLTWRLVLAGVAVGYCVVIRPTYLLFPGSICAATLLLPNRWKIIRWFCFGLVIDLLILLVPYALSHNGLNAFYTFAIRFNLDIYGQIARSSSDFLVDLHETGQIALDFLLLGMVMLTWNLLRARKSEIVTSFDRVLWLLLFASSLVSILVMRKYLANHFLPILALASPVIAYGILASGELVARLIKSRVSGIVLATILLAFLTYHLYPRNLIRHYLIGLGRQESALDYVYNQVDGDTNTGYLAEADAIRYLTPKHLRGPIEVLCYNRPYLRARAHLEAATRFTELVPLQIRRPNGTLTSYQHDWQREFVETIRKRRPEFIVVADNGFRIYVPDSPLSAARRIPGFATLMDSSYSLDTTIHGFSFYRIDSSLTR